MPREGTHFDCAIPPDNALVAGLAAENGPPPFNPFFAVIDTVPGFVDFLRRNHAPYGAIVEDDEKLIIMRCSTEPLNDVALLYLNTRSGLEVTVRNMADCAAAKAFLTRAGL